jgi:ribosomal protein S2
MTSKLPSVLSATEEDIQLLLAAQCHIGTKNCDKHMEPYVWKRRPDGELIETQLRRSIESEDRHSCH